MPDDLTRYDPADDNGKPVYAAALASAFRALRTNLSEVAVTGDYDDLVDTPIIMDHNDIDWIVAH